MSGPAPVFVLAGPDGVMLADGPAQAFPNLTDARRALADGDVPILVGALPFDLDSPAALMAPATVTYVDALPFTDDQLPQVRIAASVPSSGEHRARVAAAVQASVSLSHQASTCGSLRVAAAASRNSSSITGSSWMLAGSAST